jgi:predicted ABC-type exoprotein transport system permease subunit
MIFDNYYADLAEKFMNEIYNSDKKEYNKDLITFILISIFIIYFIFSLISSFFKLPFIILLGIAMGMYLHNLFTNNKS